jgi:hypothetical protein
MTRIGRMYADKINTKAGLGLTPAKLPITLMVDS